MASVLLAGAALARRLGANLDLLAMERFLVRAFEHNRHVRSAEGTEGGTLDNTSQALTGFINAYIKSHTLYVDKMFVHRNTPIHAFAHPDSGRPIYLQIARDEQSIVISKRAMRAYLEENDIRPRQVFNGLLKFFRAKECKLTLGAGTVFAQTQETCFEILNAQRYLIFEEVLYAWGPPDTYSPKTEAVKL
jgi:hypothetical protein